MNVSFGTFDVIVEIVPEHVNQVDGVVSGHTARVSGKQNWDKKFRLE